MTRGRSRSIRRHRSRAALEDEIGHAVRRGQARFVQRLCFVRNCYAGDTAREAAGRVGVSAATGTRWLDRWNDDGIDGLRPGAGRGGRPSKLDARSRERLRAIVAAEGPLTTAAVHDRLRSEFGVEYAPEYLPRLLRSIGLSASRTAAGPGPGRPSLTWSLDGEAGDVE